jgi:TRAP-type mannitol/chloroaromatic compound transport system permease small subunit
VVYVRRHGAAGGPYTLARNEHVRVDLVYGSVSERTRIWIDIFGGAVGLFPARVRLEQSAIQQMLAPQ